jgi:hypothetical protein
MNYERTDSLIWADITVQNTIDAHAGGTTIREEVFTLADKNEPLLFVYPIYKDQYGMVQVFNLKTNNITWVNPKDVIFPLDYELKVRRKSYDL